MWVTWPMLKASTASSGSTSLTIIGRRLFGNDVAELATMRVFWNRSIFKDEVHIQISPWIGIIPPVVWQNATSAITWNLRQLYQEPWWVSGLMFLQIVECHSAFHFSKCPFEQLLWPPAWRKLKAQHWIQICRDSRCISLRHPVLAKYISNNQ